ncbi:MAG: hypothetical protein HDR03_15510 [Lachnospiraceae bacterium]|nr:hypothetical protein [Lachnospiraceae bacterium]
MKKAKNELLEFLGGLAMLVVGLYILSQKVMVYSSFFGYGWRLGGFSVRSGMIMIPFIIGIVWMFASGGSFLSKVFTGLGVLIIIVSLILSTNISLVHMSLYEWVIILILIFGGVGLLAKILLANPKQFADEDSDSVSVRELEERRKILEVEREIEQIKRGK